jgi:hypothetical protein
MRICSSGFATTGWIGSASRRPMLAYLHEIGRSRRVAQDIVRQLQEQARLRVCDHSFADVAETATFES